MGALPCEKLREVEKFSEIFAATSIVQTILRIGARPIMETAYLHCSPRGRVKSVKMK